MIMKLIHTSPRSTCQACAALAATRRAPRQVRVMHGLPRPAGRHPNVAPMGAMPAAVRLPSPGPDGRRPAVYRPASTRRA